MPTKALITNYRQDSQLFPDVWHKIGIAAAALALIVLPVISSSYWLTVANHALVGVVGAVGLMILTGFTGQISLGHAAFLALGAYTTAILGNLHIPFWLAIPAGGLIAAAVGLAIGPFALRLQGLYLAIVTVGLLFLVQHVLRTWVGLTGGPSGIAVPMHTWFGSPDGAVLSEFMSDVHVLGVTIEFEHKLYVIFLILALLAMWMCANIRRSNLGRTLMAVRDHDLAAAALGVNPAVAKVTAFGISSFLAGVAGAMFAYQQQRITVDPFDLAMSVQYIAIIILGGMGTTFGAVSGAIFFATMVPVAEAVGRSTPGIKTLSSSQQSTLLFALLVIVFLLVEPLGLFGIWLRIKRYFVAWPFKY